MSDSKGDYSSGPTGSYKVPKGKGKTKKPAKRKQTEADKLQFELPFNRGGLDYDSEEDDYNTPWEPF